MNAKAFFISCPHSGEEIAPETPWLKQLPEVVQLRDIDRFVDFFYREFCRTQEIPFIFTKWNRYVVDLNRSLEDIDQGSVLDDTLPENKFPRGLYWQVTTLSEVLLPQPLSIAQHKEIVRKYYAPFHKEIEETYKLWPEVENVFQLDAHSMPSVGTKLHSDQGQERAEVVISDYHGTSCSEAYRDLVIAAYEKSGFKVAYNTPYVGGGITRQYGKPKEGKHCIQVELNRKLYMNEEDKQMDIDAANEVKEKIQKALKLIVEELP